MPKPRTRSPSQGASGKQRQATEGAETSPPLHGVTNKQARMEQSKARQMEAQNKAKELEMQAKDKNSTRNKALAGLGIAAALAGTIAAVALANFIASDGAVLKITDVSPSGGGWGGLIKSNKLKIRWSLDHAAPGGIPSNVEVLVGDDVLINDTGISEIDGKSFEVIEVPEDKVFVIQTDIEDTKDIKSSKGKVDLSSSYGDHYQQSVNDASSGIGDTLGAGLGGLLGGLVQLVPFILIGFALYLIVSFGLNKLSSTSKNS